MPCACVVAQIRSLVSAVWLLALVLQVLGTCTIIHFCTCGLHMHAPNALLCTCSCRFLTDEGIEFLREYLNLPSEIVPATLKKSTRPLERGGCVPSVAPTLQLTQSCSQAFWHVDKHDTCITLGRKWHRTGFGSDDSAACTRAFLPLYSRLLKRDKSSWLSQLHCSHASLLLMAVRNPLLMTGLSCPLLPTLRKTTEHLSHAALSLFVASCTGGCMCGVP